MAWNIERPTTRSTPVPGHSRLGPFRGPLHMLECRCACGWVGREAPSEPDAVAEHTAHKVAVRSGEWARLFEANARADVERRAEPHDLIVEVNARIDALARGLIEDIREDRS